jgi:hypothetical protein
LKFQGIADAKEGNFDFMPITVIEEPELELMELKLYCPLVVTIEPHTELGEDNEEPHEISSKTAHYFEQYVSDAVHLSMTDETSRGLMDYYHGSEIVNDKVYSMHPAVEVKSGELTGVCVLKLREALNPSELEAIKEAAIGQFADGWGEGFEQHAINTPLGDLYISFRNSGKDYSLRTEQEIVKPPKNRGDAR